MQLRLLTTHIRRLFHLLGRTADELHRPLGLTGAGRSVLEGLDRHGPRTVAQMARDRLVSRQHIQMIVNALVRSEMVQIVPNPAHRISPLVALTSKGVRTIKKVKAKEAAFLPELAQPLSAQQLDSALETLRDLEGVLEHRLGLRDRQPGRAR